MAVVKVEAAWLAKELGLDNEGIERRRQLFGLGPADEKRLAKIRPLVQASAPEMAGAFFQHLGRFSKSPELAQDPQLLVRAKQLKEKHLVAAVEGHYGPAYVNERLELALLYDAAHVEVAPLNGAFRHLIDLLGERILAQSSDQAEAKRDFTSLAKVLSFDLSLISEVLIYLRESTIRRLGQEASQYARSLIEASLDPLVTISPEGKITDVNDGSVKVTGLPREKLIGTDFSNYFTEPEKAREGYQQVFSKGFVTDYPLTIRHTSGHVTHVLYNATVYKDGTGNVLGVFAAARDVSKQKEAEAEIAEQRKRELARLAELERFQRLTVGRELKMIELKNEIEDLRKRVGATA